MIAAHLGIVDENAINEMSYLFFQDVLEELGYKLTYEAVVNYAGNSFCKDAWDIIIKNNPFSIESGEDAVMKKLAAIFR